MGKEFKKQENGMQSSMTVEPLVKLNNLELDGLFMVRLGKHDCKSYKSLI